MVPPLEGRALIAAWMATVSLVEPLPVAPKLRTFRTVDPMVCAGVAFHQLVAEAGKATAESASEAATIDNSLRRDVKLKLRTVNTLEYVRDVPFAPFSTDLLFTLENASFLS